MFDFFTQYYKRTYYTLLTLEQREHDQPGDGPLARDLEHNKHGYQGYRGLASVIIILTTGLQCYSYLHDHDQELGHHVRGDDLGGEHARDPGPLKQTLCRVRTLSLHIFASRY